MKDFYTIYKAEPLHDQPPYAESLDVEGMPHAVGFLACETAPLFGSVCINLNADQVEGLRDTLTAWLEAS